MKQRRISGGKRCAVAAALAACMALSAPLYSCALPKKFDDCTVALVLPEGASCGKSVQTAKRGTDVTFDISLPADERIISVSYDNYTVYGGQGNTSRKNFRITLHSVRYSDYVEIATGKALTTLYMPNGGEGGEIAVTESAAHLRPVSLNARNAFSREGYIQTGWNTLPDGGGEHYNFAGRLNHEDAQLTLYAEWQKESDPSLFEFAPIEYTDNVEITAYYGGNGEIAIPADIDGKSVVRIAEGAFAGVSAKKLVLPDSITEIEEGAFSDCDIGELVMFDSLTEVSDASFENCTLTTLQLNAYTPPAYSGNYFDSFPDKCDRLKLLEGQRKIILSGGSSARFGYDSRMIEEQTEGFEVVNMGVYAYADMRPQLDIILSMAEEGDILLQGTEFDAIDQQFCTGDELGYEIFAMTESNYDLLALLDIRTYEGVFDGYAEYTYLRRRMSEKSYDMTVKDFDEDGNPTTAATYNDYGDYILYRKNNEEMKNFGIKRAYYNAVHFPDEKIESFNAVMQKFTRKGVQVLYNYTPRMSTSLSEDSTPESVKELGIYLDERLDVPIIGDIRDSLYSPLYFFGTDNHLSTEGAKIYTQKTIDNLKKYLDGEK